MSNVEFKLPKFKIGIDPYLNEQIRCHGMLLNLFDPDEDDENQCFGYQIFKQLVFVELPPRDHVNADGQFRLYAAQEGYSLLNQLSANLRRPALDSAHALQQMAKSLRTTKNQL